MVESLTDAARALAKMRRARSRVVLANGCFDVLHVGHVRYLEGARGEGDVLVVAINSDASVRRLKGKGRPILPAVDRAALIDALEAVEMVVVFDQDDVVRVLERLRPEVHAKGTDYTVETVPERETSRRLGIDVAITGDSKAHSTRTLLMRLAAGGGTEATPCGS